MNSQDLSQTDSQPKFAESPVTVTPKKHNLKRAKSGGHSTNRFCATSHCELFVH
jgi:hypothetical protein